MNLYLQDKVFIVTGGGSGIGAAISLGLADEGAIPVIFGHSPLSDELARQLDLRGTQSLFIQVELRDEDACRAAVATVLQRFGRIDGLVNNAGISGGQARVDEVDAATLDLVLRVNVAGPFLCAGAAVRRMSTRYGGSGGAIVNITSRAAVLGSPGEFVHYAATKGALDTLTTGLALEVATEGVRVNGIAVGLIDTDFHDATGEVGRADRIRPTIPM